MSGFVARHDLWSAAQAEEARGVLAQVEKDGIETVRLSFADLHGLLRGKTIIADGLAGAMEEGCAITSTLLLKDTAHRTVAPIFSAGAGLGNRTFEGGGDMVMVPDPGTFRVLPWAPGTGWMLCDLYYADGRPVPLSTRRIARDAVADLADRGFDYVCGIEMEFHLTRLIDSRLAASDAGQPGTPPDVALLHQGYAYLTEQRFDRIEPALEPLRKGCLALGLPLHSIEVEFGPSQCEFVFKPRSGLQSADDVILFRNAVKQISRRHGYHASFMCRPQLPHAMSSGWHLHQSLRHREDGRNAFAREDGEHGLSEIGLRFLAGLLDGAVAALALTTPTINGYKRYRAHSLAPDRVAWGEDNRGAMLRVLARGAPAATRIENRVGEPAANPYLYLASQIATGVAGLDAGRPPAAAADSPYAAESETLPTSLEAALPALARSDLLRASLGDEFVDCFLMVKDAEVARYNSVVTDWEHREYFDLY